MKSFKRERQFPLCRSFSLDPDLDQRIQRFKTENDCLSDSHTLRTLLTYALDQMEHQRRSAAFIATNTAFSNAAAESGPALA